MIVARTLDRLGRTVRETLNLAERGVRLRDLADPTAITEMQIGLALRRRVLTERPSAGSDEFLFHVRTPARKEIDFVAEDLGRVAVEGKYVEGGNWRSEAATVTASAWDGILVTRNVLETPPESSAWAVPAGILAFLLDA